jgi:hypothetical protein
VVALLQAAPREHDQHCHNVSFAEHPLAAVSAGAAVCIPTPSLNAATTHCCQPRSATSVCARPQYAEMGLIRPSRR